MSVQLASAYMQIIPSMQGFQGAIAKEIGGGAATSAGSKFGSTFSGGFKGAIGPLAGIAVAGLGISKLTGYITDSVKAVGDWQALNAQSASAVKATGGAANVTATQVHNLATSLEGATSTQAESIQKGANLLLTFKGIRNEAGKGNDIFNQSTKTLVDMARAMGTEPQAAAIQLGKALNDPVKGITALTRVGVTFSDSQKKQISAMQASGNTMGAQKIILKELNSEFGGSGAAYRATFPGQLYQMRDAVGDFGEKIATAAMPALTALVGTTANVVSWATNSGIIERTAKGIGTAFTTVKTIIENFILGFRGADPAAINRPFSGLVAVGGKVADAFRGIAGIVGPALAAIGPIVQSTFGGIIAAIGPSIPVLVAAFGQLIGSALQILPVLSPIGFIFKALLPVLPTIAGLVAQLAGVIAGVLAQAAGIVVPLIAQLVTILSGVFVALMPTVVALVAAVGKAISVLAPVILGVVAALAPLIVSLVSQLAPIIVQLVGAVLPPLIQAFSAIIAAVLPLVTMLAGILIPIIKAILPVVIAVFSAIVPTIQAAIQIVVGIINVLLGILTGNWSQVWNGLVGIVSGVWNLIVGRIRGAIGIIVAVIGAVLNIIGPLFAAGWNALVRIVSTVWAAIVGFVTAYINTVRAIIVGVVSFIVTAWNRYWSLLGAVVRTVWNAVVGFVTGAINRVRAIITTVVAFIVSAWNRYWQLIGTALRVVWTTIVSVVTTVINRVRSVITSVVGGIVSYWSGVWNRIFGVLRDAWNRIASAVSTGIGKVIDFIRGLPGKALSVLGNLGSTLFKSGQSLIQGFIDGIKNMFGTVKKVASDIVGTIANFFPHSPAKEGPFSGRGWTLYSGQAVGESFAEGMTARTGLVRSAASGLVTAGHPTIGTYRTPSVATASTAGLAVAGGGFPATVTLVDKNGSLLGHMDARIDRYDLSQQLAGAR